MPFLEKRKRTQNMKVKIMLDIFAESDDSHKMSNHIFPAKLRTSKLTYSLGADSHEMLSHTFQKK